MVKKKNTDKNNHMDNSGFATIFTVIVSAVVMVFCLALLLVSYTLFTSASKAENRSRCRALTVSLSEELKSNITSVYFDSYEEESASRNSGENQLWFYLRDNINSENFSETLSKTFRINTDDGTGEDSTVTMYWKNGDESGGEDTDDIYLYVEVETESGGQTYTLTTVYDLEADTYYEDNPEMCRWKWQYDGRGEPEDE
jgi:hypothetical protein